MSETVAALVAELETAARAAWKEEEALRANLTQEIARLERRRASAYRRMNFVRMLAGAVKSDENEEATVATLRAATKRDRAPPDRHARGDDVRIGSLATGARREGREGRHAGGRAGSCCRSRLLQQPGDPRVPGGWHHRDAAKANDIGREGGGAVRQAGLCLPA
jgi:hypothetical protein